MFSSSFILSPSRLIGIGLLLAAAAARCAEIQVNAVTEQDQERQQVAQLASGNLVIVWESEADGNADIFFRLYDTEGNVLTPQWQAHDRNEQDQSHPAVAALPNGNFVIAWSGRNLDGDSYGVGFRLFDAKGGEQGREVQANALTKGPQFKPQVAALNEREFVVVFSAQDGGGNQDVYFRRFDFRGAAVDPTEIAANTLGADPVTFGDQGAPRVAVLKDGGFVIVYEDRASDDLYAVRFDASATALRAPGEAGDNRQFRVNHSTPFQQTSPSIAALGNGGFVIAFNTETNGTAPSRRVLARPFDRDGIGGKEFQIGTLSDRWQNPFVIGLPTGDFVVAWQAINQGLDAGNNQWSVWAQRFSIDGSPRIAPFQVNESDKDSQNRISLAPFNDSGYAAVWQSFNQDHSRYGVFARLFLPNNEVPGRLAITRWGSLSNREFLVSFVGQAGRPHELQAASGSNLTVWTTIYSTNTPTGAFDYLAQGSDVAHRFFRVWSP